MVTTPVGLNRVTGRFETMEGGAAGTVRGPRCVYDASKTATVATEAGWVPPPGYVLDGFEVIAIAAGGGATAYASGSPAQGGERTPRYVPAFEIGATVTITVGAGVVGGAGGDSSFGVHHVVRGGGFANGQALYPGEADYRNQLINASFAMGNYSEGSGSQNSPFGSRGGGGGANDSVGGAVFPHPNARPKLGVATQSRPGMAAEVGSGISGNPVRTQGADGHPGIGDYPGGGGNGSSAGPGGIGGFPGGAAGFGASPQRGGHGRVIVYPFFRKV